MWPSDPTIQKQSLNNKKNNTVVAKKIGATYFIKKGVIKYNIMP